MNTALVLSGGGAKGAFQAGALAELDSLGLNYQHIAGVSVGVLNGLMVASGRINAMVDLWQTIRRDDVYVKYSLPRIGLQYIAYKIGLSAPPRSLYSNKPLFNLLKKHLAPARLKIPITVGRVNLQSGEYRNDIQADGPDFFKEVLASTSIPVIWPPVMVNDTMYVDGGIRNMTPLNDAVKTDPDRIIVITNRPLNQAPAHQSMRSMVDIAERSLDILLDEIFVNDIQRCLQINRLVRQAAQQGMVLINNNGEPLKHYQLQIIQPPEALGSTLNFDRAHLDKLLSMGRQAARGLSQTEP